MRERKWKKQLLASVLAISLALPSSVLASEVQENGTVIDTWACRLVQMKNWKQHKM